MTARHSRYYLLGTVCLAGLAVWQIVSTYPHLCQTADEPNHLATGMEWLQEGAYRLGPENPPLARIAAAFLPYLSGQRLDLDDAIWTDFRRHFGISYDLGRDLLYRNGAYVQNLSRARMGTLPFFLLAIAIVWHWANRYGGPVAGFLAAGMFCTLPSVLGHAGLATTDIPFTATLLCALYAFVLWIEMPAQRRAAIFGLALGLALITKFSALIFFPVCALTAIVLRGVLHQEERPADRPRWSRGVPTTAAVCTLLVWAAYRFSFGSVGEQPGAALLRLSEQTSALPAPEFFLGLRHLSLHSALGHGAYAFGEIHQFGFWYFYPLGLAIKTPIPFMLFCLAGCVPWLWKRDTRPGGNSLAPLMMVLAILLSAAASNINIGSRHVLIVYPLLAIAGGIGTGRFLNKKNIAGWVLGALLAWQVFLGFTIHPNYLAYFNLLAGPDPAAILLDSDLDWGQDLPALEVFFKEKEAAILNIAYSGTALPCRHNLPELKALEPHRPVTGWVAISEMCYRGVWDSVLKDPCDPGSRYRDPNPQDQYAWLKAYEPVAYAGKSIRIYHIP